jgi:replication-associated recombination protein RarA
MELYKKVRPTGIDSFFGNSTLKQRLTNTLHSPHRPDVYMFTGCAGCGKTTLAHIVAKELGVTDPGNIIIQNASNNNGVNDVRELTGSLRYNMRGTRVFIIDEVHRYTSQAWKAFLTPIEEPLNNTYIIFCTTSPEQIGSTDEQLHKAVMTRCTSFQVDRLSMEEMFGLLEKINEEETLNVTAEILFEIVKVAEGIPRQAIQLLGSIIGLDSETAVKRLSEPDVVVKNAEERDVEIFEVCKKLLTGESNWSIIAGELKALRDSGKSAEGLRLTILKYAASLLINGRMDYKLLIIPDCFSTPYYDLTTAWPLCIMDCARYMNEVKE